MDDREKLVELLKSILPNFRNNMAYWGEKPIYEFADCLLANDVTVVVRCKDCKYFKTLLCQNEDNHENWFCADGERREHI